MSLLSVGDLAGEALQLTLREDFVVDHADEELFDGASAQAIDNLAHGAGGDLLGRVDAAIDIAAAVDTAAQIALFFEARQDGSRGGFFHGMTLGKRGANVFAGGGAALPHHGHHQVFEGAEGSAMFLHALIVVALLIVATDGCRVNAAPFAAPFGRGSG